MENITIVGFHKVSEKSTVARATVKIGSVTIRQVKLAKNEKGEYYVLTPSYRFADKWHYFVELEAEKLLAVKNAMLSALSNANKAA